jgi:peptidyl-prolyl cis-trans isomerase SurA
MRIIILTLILGACGGEAAPVDAPLVSEAPAEAAAEPSAEQEVAVPGEEWERSTDTEIVGPRAKARHILVAYEGAAQAQDSVGRSKDEAEVLAARLRAEVLGGADFTALAKEHSDGSTASRGGQLGTFGMGVMHENFERAVFELKVSALSDVIQTPFGFHIIERQQVVELRVAQVLVQWKGRPHAKTSRSKEQAEARAEEALSLIRSGKSFVTVAKSHSDGGTGKRGSDLGWFQKGQMVPAFDRTAFGLSMGQTSEVLESPLGYHIIHRLE